MNASAGGKAVAPALADFITLNEEIAALARARLPLESHLAQLGAELPGKAGELAERIGRQMESGETLSAAMDAECADLPAVYRAVVVAGAESGQLASALESLVDTASRLDQLRRVTGMALLYPLVVVIIACLLLGLILTAVVPNFDWLYVRHFGWFAQLAKSPWAIDAIAFWLPVVVVIGAAIWWWRSGRVAGAASTRVGALGWLPWVRGAHRAGQAATLADLLRLLVDRGVPLDRALRLAGDAVDNRRIRVAAHALADDVHRGQPLLPPGELLADARLAEFPHLVRLALRHASDRRLLSGSLAQAATIYRERAIRAAEWYAEYLPVLLTITIAGSLTAFFALLIFWPYASMLHELSNANWK
jgi:general secretion pathway protein F